MGEYIGRDVSLKETAVSIRREGKRVWRGKCASDPQLLAELIRKHAREVVRVVFGRYSRPGTLFAFAPRSWDANCWRTPGAAMPASC